MADNRGQASIVWRVATSPDELFGKDTRDATSRIPSGSSKELPARGGMDSRCTGSDPRASAASAFPTAVQPYSAGAAPGQLGELY